jgi:hypothetical protein
VRFLDVGAEGFLGLGEKHFLIPIEAVSEEGVTVDQSREKVAGSPAYAPGIVPPSETRLDMYNYYGYPRPPRA